MSVGEYKADVRRRNPAYYEVINFKENAAKWNTSLSSSADLKL
jgi:hypothetical protein